jgi:hypothetical protein
MTQQLLAEAGGVFKVYFGFDFGRLLKCWYFGEAMLFCRYDSK